MRYDPAGTNAALVAHLLGLGAGTTMIVGLVPGVLALVRALI